MSVGPLEFVFWLNPFTNPTIRVSTKMERESPSTSGKIKFVGISIGATMLNTYLILKFGAATRLRA